MSNEYTFRSDKLLKKIIIGSFISNIILAFAILSLFCIPFTTIEESKGGYITFPSTHNTMCDCMTNATIESGTIENLTIADEECVNITINDQSSIEFGWQLIYISDDYSNFVNMTLNFTIICFEEINISIEVFHLIEGVIPIQGQWSNWVNLTLLEGKNTFDNITLVGEGGYYENVTEAFGAGGMLCNRNGIFEIRFKFPAEFNGIHDYELLIDQVVMNFYVTKFASYLFNFIC
jgi:hypothetical protein